MKNSFLFNSLTVLRIYIFRKYGPNTLNGQQPIQGLLSRRWGDRSFKSSSFCTLFYIYILSDSLRFSRFPSSLPLRTPTCCSFLPLPPFPLGSQPPVFPHLLILLVLKNTCHKYDNNIFHHLLPSSSCCLYIDLHSLQEPCMYIALHPGELNTRLHVVHLS